MNFCIIFSPNWLQYIYVEVFAIVKTNPNAKKIYLISDQAGKPKDSFVQRILQEYGVEIIFMDFQQKYNEAIRTPGTIGRFSKYTLYRLLIPQLLPEDKLLYIDADAIVNGDLSELYDMDMEDADIVGVRDIGILDIQLAHIGKNPGDPYINAGVLLMNLKQIREKQLSDVWIHSINTRPTSCFDQDIINSTCKIKLVSNIYNSSLSTDFAPLNKIKIAHYAGHLHEKGWCGFITPMHRIWIKWEREYAEEFNS